MVFDTAFIKKHGLFAVGLALFLFIFFKNAWVADDAYIAFRSVEQVFAGNGPRWNFDERVQVYTSPLWFALLLVGRTFSSNLFLVSILLSACCCVGALCIARKIITNDLRWLAFILLITGAWGLMDFSSSGLENPLLYLLLSGFIYFYVEFFITQDLSQKKKSLMGLMSVVGLLAITRHDVSTLIFLPTVYFFYAFCKFVGFGNGLKFFFQKSYLIVAPITLWTIFSIVYYGAPFPNTAYAKMLHGIPRADLIDFGLLYLQISLFFDNFSQLILLSLLVRVFWKREAPVIFLLSGVLLNFCYIVYVGGDFMQGRFISEAIFIAALGFMMPDMRRAKPVELVSVVSNYIIVLVLSVCLALFMLTIESPLKLKPDAGFDLTEGRRHYSWRGILNERDFYFKTNSLWAYVHRDVAQPFPDHKWCKMGINARNENKLISDFGGIGMYGYCAGLDLIVVDNLALGEPFLARLPKPKERDWRAGHFRRDSPQGYYESRLSGQNHLVDKHLAALWDDMILLTRAPLFQRERWRAIWRVNTGFYTGIGEYYFADIASQADQRTPDTIPR